MYLNFSLTPYTHTPVGIVIGGVGGAVVMMVSKLLNRLRIDDVVDAVAVHLGCGVWSAISAPFFANTNTDVGVDSPL